MAGRHSSFTQAKAAEICRRISEGGNLLQLSQEDDMPSTPTIYAWFKANPSFLSDYAHAREIRGEARADRMDQTIQDLEAGRTDWQVARLKIDTLKWQAAHEAPKIYGDNKLEISGSVDVSKGWAATLAERRKKREPKEDKSDG